MDRWSLCRLVNYDFYRVTEKAADRQNFRNDALNADVLRLINVVTEELTARCIPLADIDMFLCHAFAIRTDAFPSFVAMNPDWRPAAYNFFHDFLRPKFSILTFKIPMKNVLLCQSTMEKFSFEGYIFCKIIENWCLANFKRKARAKNIRLQLYT